jgi:hypothetical protein
MSASVELNPSLDLYETTGKLGECTLEKDGKYRMVVYLGETQRRTLWFDAKRSFVPVEVRLDIWDPRKNAIIENAFTTATTWKDFDGVQLPTKVVLQQKYYGTTDTVIATEWKDVNVPLTLEDFDLSALEVPLGTPIFDGRFAEQKISKYGMK